MTERTALVEFHYARDGRNPVRYARGATVPVKPEHVVQLEAEGKIEARLPVGISAAADGELHTAEIEGDGSGEALPAFVSGFVVPVADEPDAPGRRRKRRGKR
ncbi:MAG: hypothetical protein AB7I42_24905 [Bradyrhizobium sp.]|uniref:hypothetical protein n=1 Tax=Bradyrhizobium sp. TaxID=376 RepID=UPI003D0BBD42